MDDEARRKRLLSSLMRILVYLLCAIVTFSWLALLYLSYKVRGEDLFAQQRVINGSKLPVRL
jgi:hypothetical protein